MSARASRVLHIHTLPLISGSGLNTLTTMIGLSGRGYEVELAVAPGGDLISAAEAKGICVHLIPHLVNPIRPVRDSLALLELVRLIRHEGYDLVHTHNSKAGFLGRLAAVLALVRAVVHTVHGFAFLEGGLPWWRKRLYLFAERLASRWCDAMIFISQPLMDIAVEKGIARAPVLAKVYSGIDLEVFQSTGDGAGVRERLGLGPEHLVVGIVAKLWRGKGHKTLMEAAALLKGRFSRLRLLVVGEGYLRQELEEYAHKLGIAELMRFTGFRDDVPEITHVLDVAVLPSEHEGMGRVILEAMAAGKPVVATRVGGIPDLVVEGETGFLVSPTDPKALASALARLLTDGDLRRRMGQAARSRIGEEFSVEYMVEQIASLYQQVLVQKGHTGLVPRTTIDPRSPISTSPASPTGQDLR